MTEKKPGNYENAYLLIIGEMKCELKNIVMYCQLIDILFECSDNQLVCVTVYSLSSIVNSHLTLFPSSNVWFTGLKSQEKDHA